MPRDGVDIIEYNGNGRIEIPALLAIGKDYIPVIADNKQTIKLNKDRDF